MQLETFRHRNFHAKKSASKRRHSWNPPENYIELANGSQRYLQRCDNLTSRIILVKKSANVDRGKIREPPFSLPKP